MKSTDPGPSAIAPQIRVWDLPTRLFHWSLVLLFGLSWWSAEQHVDRLHLWSGYALLAALLFRILWGFAGSSTARFAGFVRGPSAVLQYLRNWRSPAAGHSPLGGWAVIALLVLLAAEVALGLFATDEDGEMFGPLAGLVSVESSDLALELHEASFDLLLILFALHVAAILAYRLFLGKRLVGPMVTGRTDGEPGVQPMREAPRGRALACLAAALGLTLWIVLGAPPLGG